ncbi:PKD domain-containing protein [Halobaculum halobium]|uniref:PKD domain-containing protein n=1 Tax=Halobaculum halobium TaxID=3032281 RepID=UPI0036195CA8
MLTGEELTLNASESADPDGEIVAYEWDLGGTAVQTGETVSREYADDGTYAVTLTVTDDDGASASLTRNVTVENRPPELWLTRVSPDTTPVETYETVEYTVDALDDDGTAGNTSITFTSPTNRTRTVLADGTTTVRFNESGNWTVVATVFDDDGATTTVNRTLPVNAPPDAGIDARTEVVAGESVTLSADAVDTDGTVREYTWLVGNDSYTGQNVTVTLSEAGDVRVDLFVEDDDGAVTEVNRTIEVEPAYDLSLEVEPLFGGRVLSASSYPDYRYDDENVSFEWDLDGDGRFETAGGYVHDRIVNESGTYEVAVRVSGPEIPTTTETETVSVDSVDTNVTIDWRRDVGIGETVTVTNDRVIVSGGEEQAPEGEDEGGSTIRALSRSNGSTIWEATLPFGAYETIVRDGAVYAVGEGVARVDVDTGAVDWTWSGDGYVDATVAGESVYVTDDRRAVALAIDDGLERWNRTADAPVYEQVVGADVIATYGQTYNETSNRLVSSLVVRDRDTGTILWSLTREGAPSLAGVVDGRVLVSTDGNLTARDAGDGEELWTRRLPDAAEYSYISDVRIEGDTIYAMAEQYPNRSVTALRSNGTRVWSTRVRDDAEFRVGPEHVVVAAEGGVTAYDRTDGSVVWNRSLSIDYPNVVRIVDGRVLVESDGIGTVLDAETGETRWRGATDYALYGAGYRDGTLYVGTGAGVYAVSVEDDR